MWEIDWGVPPPHWRSVENTVKPSTLEPGEIESVYALYWSEHCVECALPECYTTCPLYVRRADQRCARFQYGIFPNPDYRGPFGYGADIYFRRWGKIDSQLRHGTVTVPEALKLARYDSLALKIINPVASAWAPLNPKRHANRKYSAYRESHLRKLFRRDGNGPGQIDALVVEVWNPGEKEVDFVIEALQEEIRFRTVLRLVPGHNFTRIPFDSMHLDLSAGVGHLLGYPDKDQELRLIFTWFDLVKFRASAPSRGKAPAPAAKVKCVVWDLDNALWNGILIEDGPQGISLRPESASLVRQLDERGIIQSIASKNDYAQAWPVVGAAGLWDYFLYPAIHWGTKSSSIREIADRLDIGIDSLAVIDDSAFERSEISQELPQVRTYSDSAIGTLLQRPEFQVPVTEESRRRRGFYLAEQSRQHLAESYSGRYEEFLRSCKMEASVFTPHAPEDVARCLELLQRSNQLNLSTHRYDQEEFLALLKDPAVLAVAWKCRDRFGDYGTVGFSSIVTSQGECRIKDFVLSCRVARKKVENGWFAWLLQRTRGLGYPAVHAWFVPTDRNGVLLKVFREVGFVETDQKDGKLLLTVGTSSLPPQADVVKLIDEGTRMGSGSEYLGR